MFYYTTKIERFIVVNGTKLSCPIFDRYYFQIKKQSPLKVVTVVSMQQNSSIFNGLTVWKDLWVSFSYTDVWADLYGCLGFF